jgi:hypothetical protein
MSADNGVYIMRFAGHWYVKHTQAIDDIYDDEEYFYSWLDSAEKFTKEKKAWKFAKNLARRLYVLEYGISEIPEPDFST